MEHWINAVGYSIPHSVRFAQSYIYKGDPLYKVIYGRYDLDTSVFEKLMLIKDNGK